MSYVKDAPGNFGFACCRANALVLPGAHGKRFTAVHAEHGHVVLVKLLVLVIAEGDDDVRRGLAEDGSE